jgi:heme-degrading monooxygenase HmoA
MGFPHRRLHDGAVTRLLIFWTRPSHLSTDEADAWAREQLRRVRQTPAIVQPKHRSADRTRPAPAALHDVAWLSATRRDDKGRAMARNDAVTLINVFEVPPDADEPFIAGFKRARDFMASTGAHGTTALHRSLRPDAAFRFVNVARVESPQAWRDAISDPAFPGGRMPFKAHPALYEVVREDGAPDGEGGVLLINPFEVSPEDDERFLAGWSRARDVLAEQHGYVGTRLYRSLAAADFRFVNVARWSSPLAFAKATDQPAFQQAAAAMPFAGHPALYNVIRD